MRILYFHQHFSTRQGAAATRSFEMAQALIAAGHSVTMVCGSFDAGVTGLEGAFRRGLRRGEVAGIDVIELELPYSNYDRFRRRTWIFMRYALRSILIGLREPCDLLFTSSAPLTAALPGIIAKGLRRKPMVFEVRDRWPELPRAMGVIRNPLVLAAMDALEWAACRSADARVGLAPGIRAGIHARAGNKGTTVLIPNGCDLDLFSPLGKTQPRPDGVAESDFLAVYAGTLGIANGLSAVLDVAEVLVQRERTDIKIMLVGDGRLRPGLQECASRRGLSNVLFVDPVPKAEMPAVLRMADLGLMVLSPVPAFSYGTSPNKFFDYIATGLPVLNNYPGWVADLITANDCGRVVPAKDPLAFAEALIQLADTRQQLSGMSDKALQLAREQFDRKQLAVNLVQTLENVVQTG